MLDLLSNYQWDRPLSLLNMGGDLNIGIKDYLMYDGFSYRFTPIKNKITSTDAGKVDALELYDRVKNLYKWDALKRTDYFVDYQNMYTFLGVLNQRQLFLSVANALIDIREYKKAIEVLDLCQENFPEENFPLETISVGFTSNDYMVAQIIENYYFLGEKEKGRSMAIRMVEQLLTTAGFYMEWGRLGDTEFETASRILLYIAEICRQYGDTEVARTMTEGMEALLHVDPDSDYELEHRDSE